MGDAFLKRVQACRDRRRALLGGQCDAGLNEARHYKLGSALRGQKKLVEAVAEYRKGIELDPNLVATANAEAARQGIAAKAKFVSGNLFAFDFKDATVITMYLLPHINLDLRPRILNSLRPGTLYGALDRLVDAGLVAVDREEIVDGRLRRYYRLAEAGSGVLTAETERMRRNVEAATARLRAAKTSPRLSGGLA